MSIAGGYRPISDTFCLMYMYTQSKSSQPTASLAPFLLPISVQLIEFPALAAAKLLETTNDHQRKSNERKERRDHHGKWRQLLEDDRSNLSIVQNCIHSSSLRFIPLEIARSNGKLVIIMITHRFAEKKNCSRHFLRIVQAKLTVCRNSNSLHSFHPAPLSPLAKGFL